jgi:hypothetical protein
MNAPYATRTGPKQECREAFIAAVRANIVQPRNFFLLPSQDAYDADLVHQHWPQARITGVEKDTAIFDHLDRQHPNIYPFKMTVHQYVSHFRHITQPPFDAAFIDYTGTASLTNVADVCEFTAHLAAPTFILGLTFIKNARSKMSSVEGMIRDTIWLEEEEVYGQKPLNTTLNVATMVCTALNQGVSPGGGREKTPPLAHKLSSLDILDQREYQADETSTKMHFIILRVRRFPPLTRAR